MDTKIHFPSNRYVVSFKRRHSGRLINVRVDAKDVPEASRKAAMIMFEARMDLGPRPWREYGVSKATVVLNKHVYYSADGVFEEWRHDGYKGDLNGRVIERRRLTRKEVRKFT